MQKMLVLLFSFTMFFITSCGDDNDNNSTPVINTGGNTPIEGPDPIGFPASVTFSQFVTGLNAPLQITNAGDGSNRIFVVEKGGLVKIINNGTVSTTPFLDISGIVSGGAEQGLLSIAFPKDYSSKRYFYANFTNKVGIGNTVVARFLLTADPNVANSADPKDILGITQPFANHNGGQLAFGPDGYLYIATGDGGGAGDPLNSAQNKTSLLGKILRIDVESGVAPYSIPASNPFSNEVWSYGLRNPWRFSFDRKNGELYIADVGQNMIEEINVQTPVTPALNYGWPIMEGTKCFNNPTCDPAGLILPVTEYDHTDGDCSVIGGHVYRGSAYPALRGLYIYGDLCSGKIRGLKRIDSKWESKVLVDTNFRISSFGEDEAGNIYFSDLASGTIYKIEGI